MNISRIPKRIFGKLSKSIIADGDMTIITGANSLYYDPLKDKLLASISYYEPHAKVLIWNLGLNAEEISYLNEYASSCGGKVLDYPEKDLPEHYAMVHCNYSFKSYCIFHSLPMITTKYVMWLDAGCALLGPLDAERNIFRLYGYYSPYSSTSVGKLTHPTVMNSFFKGEDFFAHKQMLSGGVQGWNMDDGKTLAMLSEWYNLTRMEDNIAPLGSAYENHRFDQSLLSLLYYSRHDEVPYLARYTYNIGIHYKGKFNSSK